jgi:hypothetical protein
MLPSSLCYYGNSSDDTDVLYVHEPVKSGSLEQIRGMQHFTVLTVPYILTWQAFLPCRREC